MSSAGVRSVFSVNCADCKLSLEIFGLINYKHPWDWVTAPAGHIKTDRDILAVNIKCCLQWKLFLLEIKDIS